MDDMNYMKQRLEALEARLEMLEAQVKADRKADAATRMIREDIARLTLNTEG